MTRRNVLCALPLGQLRNEYRQVCRRRRVSSLGKPISEWKAFELVDEIVRLEAEHPKVTVVRFS